MTNNLPNKIIDLRRPKTRLDIIPAIKNRFSPRVFSSDAISKADLRRIFEAARLAPSGRNHQPWQFYIVRKGSKAYPELTKNIPERNIIWAKTAPVIVVACYDPSEPTDGINKWAQYDLGQAVSAMVIQAQEDGIYARQMGSFDAAGVAATFKLPKTCLPLVLIALGKIGREDDYAEADPLIVEKELQPWARKESIVIELE